MLTMREILNQCSHAELCDCAYLCSLPNKGNKGELVSTIMHSGLNLSDIFMYLSTEQLRVLCRKYNLKVSGSRDILIKRLFEIAVIPNKSSEGKATKKKCLMCEHLYDQRAVHKHHFIPKSRTEEKGGTVLLCGNCHSIFHRRQTEEETEKRHKLSEDEIRALFKRTKKEMQAGKYGRK